MHRIGLPLRLLAGILRLPITNATDIDVRSSHVFLALLCETMIVWMRMKPSASVVMMMMTRTVSVSTSCPSRLGQDETLPSAQSR